MTHRGSREHAISAVPRLAIALGSLGRRALIRAPLRYWYMPHEHAGESLKDDAMP